MYTTTNIAAIINGSPRGEADHEIVYLATDSRKIAFPSQTVFFALRKERRDGHQFIRDVYEQGVRCFVVSEKVETGSFPGAAFIKVNDSMQALQQLAAYHRSQFQIPVIGITGSNGKTIVKEWLNQLLHADHNIVRSPKSYNSQLGVPLSVWLMNPANDLGIFEAGISKPGEMNALQKIIQPTIGVLTNIGPAHNEGFTSLEEKLADKLRLFEQVQILICSTDNPIIKNAVEKNGIPIFSWGKEPDCDIKVISRHSKEPYTELLLEIAALSSQPYAFQLPFTDDASIENALHCIAVMCWMQVPPAIIAERLLLLQPVEMRLEWKKAIGNCYVLNDSYSNDLSSFIIALDYIQQQKRGNKITVFLTDFAEAYNSDADIERLYSQVLELLLRHNITRLIAIGNTLPLYAPRLMQYGIEVLVYATTAALMDDIPELFFSNESILVKGARAFGLETVVAFLEQQSHQTVLEINLTAMAHNLKQYRQLLQPSTKIMVMVKAFGYGTGDAEVAKLLQFNKVDYLAVAYADEGVVLRKAGIHLPIMVMNPEPDSFASIENHNLEPELYSLEILESFARYCDMQGLQQYPVHIKLDTGMHRLGFEKQDIEMLAERLAGQNAMVVKSVFTHLAASENPAHDGFTQLQTDLFTTACDTLREKLRYQFTRHAANTAAIRRHPDKHFDMVRLGIGLYGVDSTDMNLQVVTTLKTTVAQVKQVKAGETVGYNRQGIVLADATIATVRIGYADGYRRILGNGVGQMWLNGQMAPVLGNVAMDMTMIDVTAAGKVNTGDEVEIFGSHISIEAVAQSCDTIPYEIMTSVSQRVKRVYLQE